MDTTTPPTIRACNPVVGCTIGCPWCRAKPVAIRRKLTEDFSKPVFHERRTRMFPTNNSAIFDLCTMSDLSDWKDDWVRLVFDAMVANPQHIYLLSTSRPGRLMLNSDAKDILERSPNVWIGTTVMAQKDLERIEALRWNAPARHYFVNFEPLLSDIDNTDLKGIDWITIGNLTGPYALYYPTYRKWAMNVIDMGMRNGIPMAMRDGLKPIVGSKNFHQEYPFHNHERRK